MSKIQTSHDIYPDSHFQPIRLERNQMKNPVSVFREFFQGYNLPQARNHFKDILKDAMTSVESYAIDYLTFYDDTEKLIEAAWLILQNNKEQEAPFVKAGEDQSFTAALQLLTLAIRPERIFLLAKEGNRLIDLLIIVPDRDAKPFKHCNTIVSTVFHHITDLSFSLHTLSSIQEALTAASPFYLHACTPAIEVYAANGAIPLSIPQPSPGKAAERQKDWDITEHKANDFFECAKLSFEHNNFATALFMCHQAAELCLYGLITALWGREIKEHSLTLLHRHIRRLHHPELNRLLSPQTEEEKQYLHLLESAYLKARYNTTFQPTAEQVTRILGWTLNLLDACNEAAHLLLTGDSEE